MSELTTLTLDKALSEAGRWIVAANYEQAILRCNELVMCYPDAVRILQARAQAYEMSGDMPRAIEDYRRILDVLPCDSRAMVGLARCLVKAGQTSEASVLARQALVYAPNDADALKMAGGIDEGLIGRGRIAATRSRFLAGLTNKAIAEMRRMNLAEPDRTDVQVVLAEMLWRDGFKITTIELCQGILDEQPDCLNAHVILAALWSRIGNTEIAAFHQCMVERFDPEYRVARDWLAEASPYTARDIPAKPAPPIPVEAEAPHNDADGERDRSAWVDELIAAAGPVTPTAVPEQPQPAGGTEAARPPADESTEGNVETIPGLPPLEWTPLQTNDEDAAGIPAWLTALQAEKPKPPIPEGAVDDALDLPFEPGMETAPGERSADRSATVMKWSPDARDLPPDNARIMPAPAAQTPPATDDAPAGRQKARRAKGQKTKPSAVDTLALARSALQAGSFDEAAEYYTALINDDKNLEDVLADLDAAAHAYPQVRRFYALLGDVYTRKGEVNAALMAYHRALESDRKEEIGD
ncbi:MAG: tetratricopeptide repeat protein [Chloroflexi bacterium]|nr:tetratricopeptide repeat protein [Chloroflexota bacterium]MCL5275551.1 tetratricopeptide repeat protein [Chloroflexota bacterium]